MHGRCLKNGSKTSNRWRLLFFLTILAFKAILQELTMQGFSANTKNIRCLWLVSPVRCQILLNYQFLGFVKFYSYRNRNIPFGVVLIRPFYLVLSSPRKSLGRKWVRVEVPGFSRLWAFSGLWGEGEEEISALLALLGVSVGGLGGLGFKAACLGVEGLDLKLGLSSDGKARHPLSPYTSRHPS